MIGRILRKLTILAVFVAGTGSVMATPPPLLDFYFEEISVSPLYRCPGTDARLQWSLNKPARVVVERGGKTSDMGRETELVLPAAELDAGPDVVRFGLNIVADAPYTPLGEAELATIRGITRVVEPLREGNRLNWNYLYRLDPAIWDPRLRVVRVSIVEPANRQCSKQDAWDPRWQVERRSGNKFVLDAKNEFERNFEPPVPAVGEWVFVADPVEQPSSEGEGYRPACPAPTLEFSVTCADEPASE